MQENLRARTENYRFNRNVKLYRFYPIMEDSLLRCAEKYADKGDNHMDVRMDYLFSPSVRNLTLCDHLGNQFAGAIDGVGSSHPTSGELSDMAKHMKDTFVKKGLKCETFTYHENSNNIAGFKASW